MTHALFLSIILLAVAQAKEVTVPAGKMQIPNTPVTVNAGPMKLTDGSSYVLNVPTKVTAGVGEAETGLDMDVTITMLPEGCSGKITVTTVTKAKVILPKKILDGAAMLTKFIPELDALTAFSTDYVELQKQENIIESGAADMSYELKDLSPPSLKLHPIFEFLGMDVKFTLGLSLMTQYEKGLEVPVDLTIDILKKDLIKLPSDKVCGPRKDKPCAHEKCGFHIKCRVCQGFCKAIGMAIDVANQKPGGNLPAAVSISEGKSLLAMVKGMNIDGGKIPDGTLIPCTKDPTKDCLALGDRSNKCPGSAAAAGAARASTTNAAADTAPLPGDAEPLPTAEETSRATAATATPVAAPPAAVPPAVAAAPPAAAAAAPPAVAAAPPAAAAAAPPAAAVVEQVEAAKKTLAVQEKAEKEIHHVEEQQAQMMKVITSMKAKLDKQDGSKSNKLQGNTPTKVKKAAAPQETADEEVVEDVSA